MADPKDPFAPHRCRTIEVPYVGRVEVPRYVSRLETSRTAGWQVRFATPSRFFSDSTAGGPEAALAEAKRYLRSAYAATRTAAAPPLGHTGNVGAVQQQAQAA